MNRYKRRGWFLESARHSLAAKGVRTGRRSSFGLIKKIDEGQPKQLTPQEVVEEKAREKKALDVFKSPEEKSDYGKNRRRMMIDEIQNRMSAKFRQLEGKSEMTFEDSIRFLDHEYAPIARRFLDGNINADQFQQESGTAFDYFVKNHKKSLKPFDWGESDQDSFFNWQVNVSGPTVFDFEGQANQKVQ